MKKLSLIEVQRHWSILVVVIFVLGASWTIMSRVPSAQGGEERFAPREGFLAPDFTLGLLNGGQVTLSDLRGQVVVNFWASWCPPCRAEMPSIEKAFQLFQDQGVVILGVNTTYQDTLQEAAEFVKKNGLTFSIPLDLDGSVSKQYAISGLPTTFSVDREGVIRTVVVGGPMS